MFRKGPRPFYKLGGEVAPTPPDKLRGSQRSREVAGEFLDRRLGDRRSPSTWELPSQEHPATAAGHTRDDVILPRKSKSMFVDSAFFSPSDHPTWEHQVNMAKKIAASLSDVTNRHSRGQSMYEKRQKRSNKWIHQGGTPLSTEDMRPTISKQTKPLLELVLNPQGQLLDLQSLQDQGVVISTEGISPEVCSELIRDLHEANGRGGQLFAKRKRRAEKWVVDELHPEPSRPGDRPTTSLPRPRPPPPSAVCHQQQTSVNTSGSGAGASPDIKPLWLDELWQPSKASQFFTNEVNSPRAPAGWTSPGRGTVSDTVADTLDWSGLTEQQQQQQQQMGRRPAPAATLFDTAQESLKAMEKRRKLGLSNYNTAAQAWTQQDSYYRPITFTQKVT